MAKSSPHPRASRSLPAHTRVAGEVIDLMCEQRRRQLDGHAHDLASSRPFTSQSHPLEGYGWPSQIVLNVLKAGLANIGPLSEDDDHILIRILYRLGEIEAIEGRVKALVVAQNVACVFADAPSPQSPP